MRALVVAGISGLAINWLSSFFSGTLAIVLMLLCVAVLVVLHRRSATGGADVPGWVRVAGSVDNLAFLAVSVLVGAVLGAVSILPLFPLTMFRVPWTGIFDPFVFEYGPLYAGYELLAALLVVGVASIALFRGQYLVRVLGFAVAAVGGAVAVFSAYAPSFNSPMQTFGGWAIAACLALSVCALAPRGMRSLMTFFRIPSSKRTVHSPERG